MSESVLTGLPWEVVWAITIAALGLALRYLRDKQREDTRRVIQEECRPPDLARGRAPGAIWSTVNGNVDRKLDDHHKRIEATVRRVLEERP